MSGCKTATMYMWINFFENPYRILIRNTSKQKIHQNKNTSNKNKTDQKSIDLSPLLCMVLYFLIQQIPSYMHQLKLCSFELHRDVYYYSIMLYDVIT